jgi:hypothetical protein
MQAKNTAPFEASNSTKRVDRPISSIIKCFYKMSECSCAWAGQTGGAIRLSLIFLVLFASRQKEHNEDSNKLSLLSFACAKVTKKSTPATIPIAIGTAVAGRPDLTSVLLLIQLNNSNHRRPIP